MTQTGSKVPQTRTETQPQAGAGQVRPWRPFESLRQEIDKIFEDFGRDWRAPFGGLPRESLFSGALGALANPAVDIVEKDDCFEISAELPGMDDKNVELKIANGRLIIKGEKKEEREEKTKESYLSERRFGAFERNFALPEDVDAQKIEATFANGVLKVKLPKRPEAQKPEQKIAIKTS